MKSNDIVRKLSASSMWNDYYKQAEIIHGSAWMKNAFVDPCVAEEVLGEGEDLYNPSLCGYYVNIVEAFDKVWCFIQSYGDKVSSVHINEDGSVYGSSMVLPRPELDTGRYYAGDEITLMGNVEPFENQNSWLWSSLEMGCKSVLLGIGEESFKEFVTLRKDYLEKQAAKT